MRSLSSITSMYAFRKQVMDIFRSMASSKTVEKQSPFRGPMSTHGENEAQVCWLISKGNPPNKVGKNANSLATQRRSLAKGPLSNNPRAFFTQSIPNHPAGMVGKNGYPFWFTLGNGSKY